MVRRLLAVSACAFTVAACGNKSDRPPPVSNSIAGTPLGCGEIVDVGVPQEHLVVIDGGPANCAADGMQCPLAPSTTAAAQCGKARVIAVCQQKRWVVSCADAGASDAAAGDAAAD